MKSMTFHMSPTYSRSPTSHSCLISDHISPAGNQASASTGKPGRNPTAFDKEVGDYWRGAPELTDSVSCSEVKCLALVARGEEASGKDSALQGKEWPRRDETGREQGHAFKISWVHPAWNLECSFEGRGKKGNLITLIISSVK